MSKIRTTVTLTKEAKGWLEKNRWFNASYELEKVIRKEMKPEEID